MLWFSSEAKNMLLKCLPPRRAVKYTVHKYTSASPGRPHPPAARYACWPGINIDQYWSMLINIDRWRRDMSLDLRSILINIDQYWSILINIDQYWSPAATYVFWPSINNDQYWSILINTRIQGQTERSRPSLELFYIDNQTSSRDVLSI